MDGLKGLTHLVSWGVALYQQATLVGFITGKPGVLAFQIYDRHPSKPNVMPLA